MLYRVIVEKEDLSRRYGGQISSYKGTFTSKESMVKKFNEVFAETNYSGCSIEDVIFREPATIVKWSDGTKTVVKCHDEPYDKEKGLAMAIIKKITGNNGNFNEIFKEWIKDEGNNV